MKLLLKRSFFIAISMVLLLSVSGCRSKYSYYLYTKNAEEALRNGDYDKAKKLISYAYIEEKNTEDYSFERCAWLFYRLGVIAEVSNNLLHAKGYYWGDQIYPGFYDKERRIAWLAKEGWQHLDNNQSARSLAAILELERLEPPTEEKPKVKKPVRKRRPTPVFSSAPSRSNKGVVSRKDTPFTHPPSRRAQGLFKVAR